MRCITPSDNGSSSNRRFDSNCTAFLQLVSIQVYWTTLLWQCIHCRRYLMDSLEEDVFHIGINDIDSFDSDDNEEIEHVHRIQELPPDQSPSIRWASRDEGQ